MTASVSQLQNPICTPSGPDWACPICTYLNHAQVIQCELCLTPKTKKKRRTATHNMSKKVHKRYQQNNIPKPKRINMSKSQSSFSISHSVQCISIPAASNRSKSVPKLHNKMPKSLTHVPSSTKQTRINRSKSSVSTAPNSNVFSIPNHKVKNTPNSPDCLPLNELFEIASKPTLDMFRKDASLNTNKKIRNVPKAPVQNPTNASTVSTRSIVSQKFQHKSNTRVKKKSSSFLGLIHKNRSEKHSHKNRRSVFVPEKKRRKSRNNLSNNFFTSYDGTAKQNQITLTKSKTHKKRLSLGRRSLKMKSSKSENRNNSNSNPNSFNPNIYKASPFALKPKPSEMFMSISLPENDFGMMQQSTTSPLTVTDSPWNSPLNSPIMSDYRSESEGFSVPSPLNLYRLPAEKHKIFAPLPQKSGNTTSVPSNFSLASHIYSELQTKLEQRSGHKRKRTRTSSSVISLEMHETAIQKHESILLEILKSSEEGCEGKKEDLRNSEQVIDTIINARCDVLSQFLPLIAFTVCQSNKLEWRQKLLNKLRDRIVGQTDLRQAVRFFVEAYADITSVKCVFAGLCPYNNNQKDAVGFWHNVASMKDLKDDDYFTIPRDTILRDPVKQLSMPLRKVWVRKVINSNSKPLLIDCYALGKDNVEFLSSTFILKYGDDLRKDKSCMLVFKHINHLFLNSKLRGIKVLTYNVVPMGNLFGCIQLIDDCVPLRDILSLKDEILMNEKLFSNLIATAAGSYIASYILSLRDRHYDNILIRTTDMTLFHIDMNYVLGDTVTGLDANKFGITKDLHTFLGKDNYNKFVELGCNAFLELRHHYRELINFVCLAFSYIYDYNKIRRHVFKQLRMSESDKKATKWIKSQLRNAPFDKQTQLKNTIHKFATR